MLALAAANFVGVVLFAALYATAGAHWLSQTAFVACLFLLFALVTSLWMRVEARHHGLEPLRRVGRVVAGLVGVAMAVPAVVLMPMFWLDEQLPVEAGLNPQRGPIMALLLIALFLTLLVNVVGGVVIAARAVLARSRA